MPAEIAALNQKRTEGPESTRGKLAPAQANAVSWEAKSTYLAGHATVVECPS
jgi:hypothetical protein